LFVETKTYYSYFTTATCSEELGACTNNPGLLTNIQNISVAEYFTSDMSLDKAALMAFNKSYIYNEAVNEASMLGEDITSYLARIYSASAHFINSNELWERKHEMDVLEKSVFSKTGTLMCVLGGKSTGKSFFLNQLESKYPENVFIINMRSYKNIVPGLIDVIKRRQKLKTIPDEFKRQLGKFLEAQGNDFSIMEALDRLLKYVKKVTIIIDEANLAMTFDENDHVKKAEAKFLAAVMTSMT
jgi:hypothetical protein